jgi:hypothetical protein
MLESDKNYVISTWIKSYRSAPFAQGMNNSIYYTNQHSLIQLTLQTANTLILCNPTDENQIIGYIVYEYINEIVPGLSGLTIHYIYVKGMWQNNRIATDLLTKVINENPADVVLSTSYRKRMSNVMDKLNVIYNPYGLVTLRNDGENYEIDQHN